MRSIIIFIIACVLLIRCDPGAITDIPVNAPRLYILAEPETGKPWEIYVSRTLPLLHPKTTYRDFPRGVEGARVMLFEDDQFVEELLTTDPDSLMQAFRGSAKLPEPGHTYSIKVEAPGYESITATYTHPAAVALDDIKTELKYQYIDGPNSHPRSAQLSFDVDITITDPSADNYYEFVFFRASSPDMNSADIVAREYLYTRDPNYQSNGMYGGAFINDKKFAGQKATMIFNVYTQGQMIVGDTLDTPYYFVQVRNLSKELAEWKTYLSSPGPSSYDPYAQPSLVKTNVKSGLGVFGGFSSSTKGFYYQPL